MARQAIFLDRDGILNEKRDDYVKSVMELKVIRGADEGIAMLKNCGYLLVIISNQSAVNRGIITEQKLQEINSHLLRLLENGSKIDAMYHCPHTPVEKCTCRKPGIGMIVQAAKEHDIDVQSSWFVGDSESDLEAGKKAGCNCILVSGDHGLYRAAQAIASRKDSRNEVIRLV